LFSVSENIVTLGLVETQVFEVFFLKLVNKLYYIVKM